MRRASPLVRSVALVLLAVQLAGCARKMSVEGVAPPMPAPAQSELASLGYVGAAAARSAPAAPEAAESTTAGAPVRGNQAAWTRLKLIRTGRIEIEVEAVGAAVAELGRLAAAAGGFVAGTELRQDGDGPASGTVTIKLPAERYDATLAALRGLGRVRGESSSVEDVTKAYADLETRLGVKRRTEERLRALLAGHSGELSELLEVERELDRVVGEIEGLLGERRWYDDRVALSTLVVALWEPRSMVRPSAFDPIGEAARDALEVLAASVAFLIYAVVFLAPWSLVALVVVALVRRRRRRRAALAAASAEGAS